ncbi:DUF2829 domain-containing protein [Mesorhizobium sp. M2D.F.Ca.ET.223.01.1.1]|uniref:Thoeris anti-defense Tad2 family protein n=1 Tax=Mesorhizobium sp. M2D.F.Ca.ET.223.01.1.1 TaxID=2563940 RepID=UPI001092C242|nr:MW1434 family type I TA system toxin [Mesorhizobium sp. M2D.F.Ca.ET.223.01.1.1]TGR81831.1 DUF2829 domain-containing protein [Mesorhizobium sp. M2D.F.Ca.ET.223.01.1.1]TGT64475.1 DUF2829 domain-containing protein [bacterium M00.F.Ca.ET.159.01.1.1]TGT79320.1 DUF2829 domain-containing protein [bacterium M00.F.Ca.ET.157.01.1.1]
MSEQFSFSTALVMMRCGLALRRAEWRPNKWVHIVSPENSLSYLEMVINDGRRAPYTPSRCDLFTDDWMYAAALSQSQSPNTADTTSTGEAP